MYTDIQKGDEFCSNMGRLVKVGDIITEKSFTKNYVDFKQDGANYSYVAIVGRDKYTKTVYTVPLGMLREWIRVTDENRHHILSQLSEDCPIKSVSDYQSIPLAILL